MPRLIFKCPYIKGGTSSATAHLENYVKYMATRNGVERIDPGRSEWPATSKQKKMVEQILRDFPLSRGMFEYEDYAAEPTRTNASEFITRALEDNYNQIAKKDNYLKYIATRPRAQRVGSHGLFTGEEDQLVLAQVAEAVAAHPGNVWLGIGGIALVVVVIVVAVLLSSTASSAPSLPGSDDGDSASSMVDIFRKKETTIPRISGEEGVKLSCQDPSGEELTIQQVYAKVNPSVVAVVAEQSDGSAAVGTGVIMTESGYIITNAHVISGGKSCWVALDTGVTYDARLVGYDEDEDLAVLRAIADNPLPAAEFGNSDLLTVGDPVYAIGNPLGVELRGTLTNGIVSAINREVEMQGRTMTMIQTNAALNNGNSGGPLINSFGQVIGINTMKMSNSSLSEEEATVEGLGFALPISSVSFVVNDLIAHGEFLGTPTIGITVRTIEKSGGGTQVEVYTVDDALGAAEAGVQPGDIILEADGQPVSVTSDLLTVRRSHSVGDTIRLTIQRDGQTLTVDVVLYASK